MKGIELNDASSSSSTNQKIMVKCKAIVKELEEFEKVMRKTTTASRRWNILKKRTKKKAPKKMMTKEEYELERKWKNG